MINYFKIFAQLFVFSLIACKEESISQVTFAEAINKGEIQNAEINEASGLARGFNNNYLWTHNDSGDEARIFLIQNNGTFLGEYELSGKTNRDWEDIAVATVNGQSYVYVADIGDNDAQYDTKYIYRFLEPNTLPSNPNNPLQITNIETISFQYPDGKRDAESLMVDPLTGDIYVISKRETEVNVYKAAYPQATSSTITLEKILTLPYTFVVAADISTDGLEVLIKTYSNVYYWKRENANTSIMNLLQQTGKVLPYTLEPQGEAIAWAKDGSGYYTLSEKSGTAVPKLYFYERR